MAVLLQAAAADCKSEIVFQCGCGALFAIVRLGELVDEWCDNNRNVNHAPAELTKGRNVWEKGQMACLQALYHFPHRV